MSLRCVRRGNGNCRTPGCAVQCPKKLLPILRRSWNPPDIPGSLQLNTNLTQFPRIMSGKNRTDPGTNRSRICSVRSRDLQRYPAFRGVLMPGRISATVKIHGNGRRSFLKDFTTAIRPKHDQRNRALDSRTSALVAFLTRNMRLRKGRRIHLFTLCNLGFIRFMHIALKRLSVGGFSLGFCSERAARSIRINEFFPHLLVSQTHLQNEAED